MISAQRSHAPIALVALLVAGLAAADWWSAPQRAGLWVISLVSMAAIWGAVVLIDRLRASTDRPGRGLEMLSAVIAGLMLAAALGARLVETIGLDRGLSDRLVGVMTGLGLAVIGNLTPKAVAPLAARRCSPPLIQSLRRFTGWTFTLAGLGYAAIWLIAPIAWAETLAMGLCAVAVTLVVARWALALMARPA